MAEEIPGGIEKRHLPRTWSGEFTYKRFGIQTIPKESRPVANIIASVVIDNNPNRVYYSIMNRSSVNVAVGFGADLTVANGLLLPPNGGWVSQAIEEDGTAVAWAIYAASAVDAAALYILEIVGE